MILAKYAKHVRFQQHFVLLAIHLPSCKMDSAFPLAKMELLKINKPMNAHLAMKDVVHVKDQLLVNVILVKEFIL